MKTGKLYRISSTHDNLRTPHVDGYYTDTPSVGQFFVMYADAIDPGADVRQIITSLVLEVDGPYFRTENSEYLLVTK
jgi:hypothetical protein